MNGHTSLQAASAYINNLLLARGLLKDGKPISFVNTEGEDVLEKDATMTRVINLINDLIVRRDVRLPFQIKATVGA